MMGTILKHLVKLALLLVVGIAATGFVAGTLDSAVPEWIELGNLVRLVGVLATLSAAIVYVVRAFRHRDEMFRWNLGPLLRPLVAALIVFAVSFAGNFIAMAILVGKPVSTGMTGGAIDPAEMPILHFGAPLVGLVLAGLYLIWPWWRACRRCDGEALQPRQ